MRKVFLILPVFFLHLLFFAIPALYAGTADADSVRVKIFSFNIQIFGRAKMARSGVPAILADIVLQSDITAIQELRSADISPVEQFMALLREKGGEDADPSLPGKYAYVLGPREGRSSSKEQYWIIYDRTKFTVLAEDTYFDPEDKFERNPLAVYFQSENLLDFILINNHLKPGDAEAEIEALPEVVAYYQNLWGERDVLVVGDFNADGQYYDESFLHTVFSEDSYRIIITNEYDTTVAASDNTYDRFIITGEAVEDFTGNFGVMRFDELYDFDQPGITPNAVSDHYPVWAEFYTCRDTD
ncbi:MAG: endonuclease [Treponema sp.]|jgi:endonuclease/exonuclease/phosphatase family metal-dependent hydrolase|nr:endonuclease [Treponema sp.]